MDWYIFCEQYMLEMNYFCSKIDSDAVNVLIIKLRSDD